MNIEHERQSDHTGRQADRCCHPRADQRSDEGIWHLYRKYAECSRKQHKLTENTEALTGDVVP